MLDNLARFKAFGADFNLQDRAVDLSPHRNEVGKPGSSGMVLSMGNVIAVHCAFAADIAYSRHS